MVRIIDIISSHTKSIRHNPTSHIADIEFSDEVMQNAVSVSDKFEHFLNDSDSYVAGKFQTGEIDENLLFKVSSQKFT